MESLQISKGSFRTTFALPEGRAHPFGAVQQASNFCELNKINHMQAGCSRHTVCYMPLHIITSWDYEKSAYFCDIAPTRPALYAD